MWWFGIDSPKNGKSTLTLNVKCWLLISVRLLFFLAFILCTRLASSSPPLFRFSKSSPFLQNLHMFTTFSKPFFKNIFWPLVAFLQKSLNTINCRNELRYPTILKLIDIMRSFPRERSSGILVVFIRVGALLSFVMQRTRFFSCSRSMAEYVNTRSHSQRCF